MRGPTKVKTDIIINYLKIIWEEPEVHNHHSRSMYCAMELKLHTFLITAMVSGQTGASADVSLHLAK